MTDWNFSYCGNFDISQILDFVTTLDGDWGKDTSRQESFYVHRNTETIMISDFDLDWNLSDGYQWQPVAGMEFIIYLLTPIFDHLRSLHNGEIGRCMFAKLHAMSNIDAHVDSGNYLDVSLRHHIAIKTNDNVIFHVGDESIKMALGDIWQINNTNEHWVINNGGSERVHLIVDIIPKAFI